MGMPYFPKGQLKTAIEESGSLKELCKSVVEAYHGADAEGHSATPGEYVGTSVETYDELKVAFPAYERHVFISKHKGSTPEELGHTPDTAYHDQCPLTGRPLELYLSEGDPHYEVVVSSKQSAVKNVDRMPQSIYASQGAHTYEYFKSRIPSMIRASNLPPPRAAMLQRMQELAAKRHQQRGDGVTHEHGSNQSAASTAIAGITSPPVFPSTPRFFAPPPPVKAEVLSQTVPSMSVGVKIRPSAAKTSGAPPASIASVAKAEATPASAAPTVKVVRAAAVVKSPANEVVKEESEASTPHKRSSVAAALPESASRRRVITPKTQSSESRPAPAPSAEQDAPRRQGSGDLIDLGKLKAGQEQSIQPDDLLGDNKFVRCLVPLSLERVLQGENVEAHLVVARRMLGYAKRESPLDHLPKLELHLSRVAGCKELVMERILKRNSFDPIIVLVAKVQEGFPDKRLPKFSWVDYCCAYAAFQHLKPWKVQSDMFALLNRLKIHGGQVVPYSEKAPSLWAEQLSDADRQSGVVPQQLVVFWETHVLAQQISAGPTHRRTLVNFVDKGLLEMLDALPSTFTSKSLSQFKDRLLALLWVIGVKPFQHRANAGHVDHLTANPFNPLIRAVKATPYASHLLDSAYLNFAGEKKCWPLVEKAVAELTNEDPEVVKKSIETIIADYSKWEMQCRDDALQEDVHPAALGALSARLDSKQLPGNANTPKYDADDAEVQWILRSLNAFKALKWTEAQLDVLLMKLIGVATSMQKSTDQAKVTQASSVDLNALKGEDPAACDTFAENLLAALPATKGSRVFITGGGRQVVAEALDAFSDQCLRRWPRQALYACTVALQERLEVDLDDEIEGYNLAEVIRRSKGTLFIFRRLQGFSNHLDAVACVGAFTKESVEKKSTQTMVQKLSLYLQYFSTDEKFKACNLQSETSTLQCAKITQADDYIKQFKLFYYGNTMATCQGHLDLIKAVAGGAEDGKSWRDTCPAVCSWPEFLAHTEKTLRAVQRTALLANVKLCSEVVTLDFRWDESPEHPVLVPTITFLQF